MFCQSFYSNFPNLFSFLSNKIVYYVFTGILYHSAPLVTSPGNVQLPPYRHPERAKNALCMPQGFIHNALMSRGIFGLLADMPSIP